MFTALDKTFLRVLSSKSGLLLRRSNLSAGTRLLVQNRTAPLLSFVLSF